VLTEAAINGAKDHLIGLKENVIIGKLIPAGPARRRTWRRQERKRRAALEALAGESLEGLAAGDEFNPFLEDGWTDRSDEDEARPGVAPRRRRAAGRRRATRLPTRSSPTAGRSSRGGPGGTARCRRVGSSERSHVPSLVDE
jgi:hypothetical protein